MNIPSQTNTVPIPSSAGNVAVKKGKDITIEVEITPCNKLHALLQRHKILPLKKTFAIPTQTIGTNIVTSKLFLSIREEILKTGNIVIDNAEVFEKHGGTFARIIAVASRNYRGKYSHRLEKLILQQFSSESLVVVIHHVINQMGLIYLMTALQIIHGVVSGKEETTDEKA